MTHAGFDLKLSAHAESSPQDKCTVALMSVLTPFSVSLAVPLFSLSLSSSFCFPQTQPHYGGSFIFDHDLCPICPLTHSHTHSHTQTHTLVVSCGLVRGCGVYCGEDVQSCRLKSPTSLVLTGGPRTIFTHFVHVRADCVHDMWFQRGMSVPLITG